jgi:hypothetical protein
VPITVCGSVTRVSIAALRRNRWPGRIVRREHGVGRLDIAVDDAGTVAASALAASSRLRRDERRRPLTIQLFKQRPADIFHHDILKILFANESRNRTMLGAPGA